MPGAAHGPRMLRFDPRSDQVRRESVDVLRRSHLAFELASAPMPCLLDVWCQ